MPSNVSSVTNFFSTANEGFATALTSTIASGATTVPLNNVSSLVDGSIFVGIVEPGAASQQVFTGTVSAGSGAITNVVWTRGTNTSHPTGAIVVDYITGTDWNMMSAGILKQHTQAGAHHALTTDTIAASGNASVGGTLAVTGVTTFTAPPVYSNESSSVKYKFNVYRSAALSTINGFFKITLDTKLYDTGSNFDAVTNNRFVAPIAGFYHFDGQAATASGTALHTIMLYKNGTEISRGSKAQGSGSGTGCNVADTLQLAAGDYIELWFYSSVASLAVEVGASAPHPFLSGYLVSET